MLFLVLGILFALPGGSATAQTPSGVDTVHVSMPDTVVAAGSSVRMPIVLSGVRAEQNIIACDFRLTYDPAVLSFEGHSTSGTLSGDANFFVTPNLVEPGSLVVGSMGTAPLTAAGTLISLEFSISPEVSGASPVTFTAFSLNQGNPPVSTFDGSITVQNSPPNPFSILHPDKDAEVTIDGSNPREQLNLHWEPSHDSEGDAIQYGFLLDSDGFTATPFDLTPETELNIEYARLLEVIENANIGYFSGGWTIFATDGSDTTYAVNGPLPLRIQIDATDMQGAVSLPSQTALLQNYPNPFNPGTTIQYDLVEATQVTLEIYDATGRAVARLVEAYQQPGSYSVTWSGTDFQGQQVAAGIYVYRLRTSDFTATNTMMLVK